MFNLNKLEIEKLWELYSLLVKKLKEVGQIRTRNIAGERGEWLAISHHNKTKGLTKLQASPQGTQNVDALSVRGERYSIKTITLPNKTTGVFYGLGNPEEVITDKKFEYLIIVLINDNYKLERMIEIDWETFWEFKKWHSRMKAFNISITKNLLEKSNILYEKG